MNEFNPARRDLAKAESIRRQYMERKDTKLDQLQALDDKVKAPGIAASIILGVLGSLIMGAGMANVMVWNHMAVGLALGISGLSMVLLAYPVYRRVTDSRKKKYAQQILLLSDEIIGEEEM